MFDRGKSLTRDLTDYAAEDFIAVDGLQDREFRVRYNARYDSSKAFRRMFLALTFWWITGVVVYLGCLSAISTSATLSSSFYVDFLHLCFLAILRTVMSFVFEIEMQLTLFTVWTLDFHYAFGASLGVLFTYIIIWAATSHFWVKIDMERQRKAYELSKC